MHELQVQLFAGHDTTLTALTWLLLAQHPEVLERCREEQRKVETPLTLESLKAMPYLHQVLQESLRFIPPVGGVFREALQDVSFKGYRIPKGWTDWALEPGQDVSLVPFPLPHPRDGLLMRVSRR